jgi:hypothetical protein
MKFTGSSRLERYENMFPFRQNQIISSFIYLTAQRATQGSTYLPLGATALGEPWPPLQPISTALFPSFHLHLLQVTLSIV